MVTNIIKNYYNKKIKTLKKKSWGSNSHPDKLDFKTKTIIRDVEGHYIILKGCIQQVYMTIINIYAHNRGAARYTSKLLTRIKRHIDNNTLLVGDLNTLLSAIDKSRKQKINKETRALNAILDQMHLIDIYRTLYPRTTEYSFFLNSHGTFSRIDHILGHRTGLNLYQKTEIIPCIYSDHNALTLEINHKEKFGRNSNTWKLRPIMLKNDWINQEIKEELKNSWKQMKMKYNYSKSWDAARLS